MLRGGLMTASGAGPGYFNERRRLLDAYRFSGFRPVDEVRGVFGDPHARIVALVRRSKKQ
jgi:hypothetical protein